MKKSSRFALASATALVALGVAATTVTASDVKKEVKNAEKCTAILKNGMNDHSKVTHECVGFPVR